MRLARVRRSAGDRHGVVIAACYVVPARRYARVVQPGALTAPSVWRLSRYRRREPAQHPLATGDGTYQVSTWVAAERVRRARPKARSCPARSPGTVSHRDCQPPAPARLPGTGRYRRSCPRCGTSPRGSRPLLPLRARLSWSPPGRPRPTGWHEHPAKLGRTRLTRSACSSRSRWVQRPASSPRSSASASLSCPATATLSVPSVA